MGSQFDDGGIRRSARSRKPNETVYGGKGRYQNMQSRYQGATILLYESEGITSKHKEAIQLFMADAKMKDDSRNTSMLHVAVKHFQHCFAQMHASKGIKEFGMRAVLAIIKELTQLDAGAVPGKNQRVCVPINPDTFSAGELK